MKLKLPGFFAIAFLYILTPASAQNIFSGKPGGIRLQKSSSENAVNQKLSPSTQLFLREIKKMQDPSARFNPSLINKRFPVKTINGQDYIGALVKVNNKINEASLAGLGVKTGSKIRDVWSVKIPVSRMQEIADLEGIDYIETDHKIEQRLDSARSVSRVDRVHQGQNLARAYAGDGVIVGIIDAGFDYTHPAFYDTSGTSLRLTHVWNQTDDSGTPPNDLDYGTELLGEDEILNAQYSAENQSHGTHVAGIAGGSGLGTDGMYTGVAPLAELVFVQYGGGASDIEDAIFYILRYAIAVGKPAVINMSLGSHIGPHDGTSIMDQTIDYYSDFGIIVGAAGNEGGTPLHGYYQFSNDDTQTVIYFEDTQDIYGTGLLDLWGSENSEFTVAVNVWDLSGNLVGYTNYVSSGFNSSLDTLVVNGGDTVMVYLAAEAANFYNNKPNIQVQLYNNSPDRVVTLELSAEDSEVHIWNQGLGSGAPLSDEFPGFGPQTGWLNGDYNYTVGEIGGTANRIVTVGAFTTRNQYTDYFGNVQDAGFPADYGAIAPFSSNGPTADGRTKPEITAPGNSVISSVNSFDENEYPSNSISVAYSITDGTNEWYFSSLQGTSMAAPMVTGIVALLLEAYPGLKPEQVKNILAESAETDGFTGVITPNGSNTWGWGKINAHQALLTLFDKIPEKPVITVDGDVEFCEGDSVVLSAPDAAGYIWSTGDTVQSIVVKESGVYGALIINGEDYMSEPSDGVLVIVRNNPEYDFIINGDPSLCEGDSIVFSATEDAGFTYEWYDEDVVLDETSNELVVKSAGNYSLVVTGTNLCTTGTENFLVTVSPYPDVPEIAIDGNMLTSSISSGNQWYRDNEPVDGATDPTYEVIRSGDYFVTVSTDAGCSRTSETVNITVIGLGDPGNEELKIYPNPTRSYVILESGLKGRASFKVVDLSGRVYQDNTIELTGKDMINLGATSPGVRILQLEHKKVMYRFRIRIE